MRQIELNRMTIDLLPAFFDSYNVYKIKANRKLWSKLDDLDFEAFCGTGSKGDVHLYILTKDNRKKVRDDLEKKGVPFDTVMETTDVPVKLLINAICRLPGYASLSGKHYCLLPVNFYKGKKLKCVVDIPEIQVSKDGVVSIHSARFVRFDPNYHDGLPAYRFTGDSMVRDYHPDDMCFVRHGIPGSPAASLAYLDTTVTGYLKSRVALVRLISDKIIERFRGLLSLKFCTVDEICVFRGQRAEKYKAMLDKNIEQHFSSGIDSDIPEVYMHYNIPRGDACSIRLIEEKDAYAEGEDVYLSSLNIQHITRPLYEKATENEKLMEPLIRACLTELAIKQDIDGSIDCFSGYIHSLDDSAVFYYRRGARFSFVKKTGMFLKFGVFSLYDPPEWVPESVLDASEEHIVERGQCVIGLNSTDMFPITDSSAWEIISREDGRIRNAALRDDVLGAMVDAHLYECDGRKYYYSSVIGNGMKAKIAKADTLLEIVEYEPDGSYDWLLPYICVTYINAGNRFSKYPYPFKYLREWQRVNHPNYFD